MAGPEKLKHAVDLLAKGDWQGAHSIAQEDESLAGCWIHGIVHLLEGDLDNARYWYRRAGRVFPKNVSVDHELTALRDTLSA